jgi:hypothetical protein
MPTFRKLSPEEVQQLEWAKSGIRKAIAASYDNYMREFAPGDYGEATLEPGEKRMTVMSRLKAAAERHDPPLKLVFRRTNDSELLRFIVMGREADEASPDTNGVASSASDRSADIAEVFAETPVSSDGGLKKRAGRPSKKTDGENVSAAKKRPGRPRKAPAS